MKRHILTLSALLVGTTVWSTVLTPEGAIQRAMQQCPRKMRPVVEVSASVELAYTLCDSTTAEAAVYAFNKPEGGWMLLPADDLAAPLLAFSDNGDIDADNLAPELLYWMQFYQAEIQSARGADALRQGRRTPKTWPGGFGRPDRATIEPLCTTQWNQNAPYNDDCPAYNGTNCVTGCVATAMAQIMKFHEWPKKGKGSYTYTSTAHKLSQTFNFGNTTFDWSNMLDSYTAGNYTTAQSSAVATLMHACGVSMDMNYKLSSEGGSGATSKYLPQAYKTYFDYDKSIIYVNRSMYTLREWEDLIYHNLITYGPVQYSGRHASGGHSFVCDGIMMNCMFHINWGWGGKSDGYFLLSALDPNDQGIGGSNGGYTDKQAAVINIHKNKGGICPTGIESQAVYKITNGSHTGFTLTGKFTPISDEGYTGKLFVMAENLATGHSTQLYSRDANLAYGKFYGKFTVSSGISSLPDGAYRIKVYYGADASDKHEVRSVAKRANYVEMNKTGSKVSYLTPLRYDTKVTQVAVKSPLYNSHKFELDVTTASEVDDVETLTIFPYLYTYTSDPNDAQPVKVLDGITGDLYNGENVYNYTGTLPSASDATPGDYYLAFVMDSGDEYVNSATTSGYAPISDMYKVTIKADPGSATLLKTGASFSIDNSSNVDKTDMTIRYNVGVSGGYFADKLYFLIFEPGKSSTSIYVASPMLYGEGGQTLSGQFTTHWDDGIPGTTYRMGMYYKPNGSYSQLVGTKNFTIGHTLTGIDDIVSADGVTVMPNPASDIAKVTAQQSIKSLTAYNIAGAAAAIHATLDGTSATLDIACLPAGVYMLRLGLEDGTVTTTRLVKR